MPTSLSFASRISASRSLTPLQSLITRRWRPQWICQDCQHGFQPRPRSIHTDASDSGSLPGARKLDENGVAGKPFYVTTPIFYVNAAPHIGHMYTMVLADVLKRWQILKGNDAVLLTGTDEHGMKIQRAADKAGMDPKKFCDMGAETFKDLAAKMGMSHDVFMRTTDPQHKEAVQYAWHILQQNGHIYQKKHEGWYSVSDETFYPQSQVQPHIDPMTGRKYMASSETGKEVEWTSELNYHFRLSAFREDLLAFYKENRHFIVPSKRMEEVVAQVEAGLEDLSISRPRERLSWGIEVPTDSSQTVYVWLDALLNYASAVGYPFVPGKESKGGWPADVHVIGKDIVRFHCIYWPAMLMALGLPLPKQILAHAHWTLGKEKMSKSTGNVVSPIFALERFGPDVMRYYLVLGGGITNDADYDNSFIIEKYKKHLQNGIGNFTSRIMHAKNWKPRAAVQHFVRGDAPKNVYQRLEGARTEVFRQRLMGLNGLVAQVDNSMNKLLSRQALTAINTAIAEANKYLAHCEPWRLLKDAVAKHGQVDEDTMLTVDGIIYLSMETLRLCGIMLQPFMPAAAKHQLDILGVADDRRSWEWCEAGKDDNYGTPRVDLQNPREGRVFPGLSSEE